MAEPKLWTRHFKHAHKKIYKLRYTGTCLLTNIASPSVPQTRHCPRTSKLLTDSVWLGSIWVVSSRALLESPLSQVLMRDWFPAAGAIALRDIMLLFLPPEKYLSRNWKLFISNTWNRTILRLIRMVLILLTTSGDFADELQGYVSAELTWMNNTNNLIYLVNRKTYLNVKKSPSAEVTHPLSM